MNDEAERISRRMTAIRQDLGKGVQEIVHGAQHIADWRHYVRRHPWACVAGTLALGFLASPTLRGPRRGNVGPVVEGPCRGCAAAPVATPSLLMRAAQFAAPLAARGVAAFVVRRLVAGETAPVVATEDHV